MTFASGTECTPSIGPDWGSQLEQFRTQLELGQPVGLASGGVLYQATNAMLPNAVARFREEFSDEAPVLLLGHPAEVGDWLPALSSRGQRFCRKVWQKAGAVLFSHDGVGGLASRLPAVLRGWIASAGNLGLLLSSSMEMQELAQSCQVPLLVSAQVLQREDGTEASSPLPRYRWRDEQALDVAGQPLAAEERAALAGCQVLFICTGNTCRSPLAEVIFKQLLADRLGCTVEELAQKGWLVRSAGVAAGLGLPASEGALEAARALGLSLDHHQSQPVSLGLLSEADYVLVMTRGHWHALAGRILSSGTSLELLSPEGIDIMDPYGGTAEAYQACAAQLKECLRTRLEGFAEELPPPSPAPENAGAGTGE